ncbi:RagB/SusD family nutrient uptake outer membrane protein [Sphingobacterium composti Ten et al. 2007 non Yoo et al. 2007]|uniref:RagB/SusD family nutrient uptake outer membrane protein n=1 Tax=Sphingobacterium composti TaxID=363260 RepID=UPI00135BCD00|nr:RagB/SusD family nutrient uptake outer membrane protein [Sphingobacterium composti Ten et al. 2007 non Yoo et al. 2007]
MKIFYKKKLYTAAVALLSLASFGSCDYLDVVPPEQADTKDMIIDDVSALRNLYACYGYLQNGNADLNFVKLVADETVFPQEWGSNAWRLAQWNAVTPSSIDGNTDYPWVVWYNGIGYCNLFLRLIEENNPTLNPNSKAQYIAEAKFLKAYYHFRALQTYGPIPIVDDLLPTNIPKDQVPGRSHFDFCVDYIVGLLDEAMAALPAQHTNNQDFGRATSIIAKALKARVLLIAASPLWNGEFPNRGWRNDKFETPGYGNELVSLQYDENKWVRARAACLDAIQAAEAGGAALYDVSVSETLRTNQQIPLPHIPGLDPNTEEGEAFRQKVMMLRYLNTARPDEGNRETIWAMTSQWAADEDMRMSSMPHYVLTSNENQNIGGWSGQSPTLYTMENFYTRNGILPEEDPTFIDRSAWLRSAELSNSDIVNLNVNREPRFYAWLSFDGDEYSPVIANRSPLYIEMRNPQRSGYDATIWGTRNYSVTGFLNKKWVHPNLNYTGAGWGNNFGATTYPITLIRLGELYLNLAECDAHLAANTTEGLDYLNRVRRRAGVPEWTESLLAQYDKSLLDAVLEERFVELYLEGHRYFDIRRYVQGRQHLNPDKFVGLDAVRRAPSFSVFNTPTKINQPFGWEDRLYLMPISNSELYANPQMVQAPGY